MRFLRLILPVLIILLVFSTAGLAQIYEFDAHAGGFFPMKWLKTDRLEAQGMYGGRMGVYSTENIQFDAAMSYANHFAFTGTDRKVGAFFWGFNASYNFTVEQMRGVEPFVTAGLGGVTADVRGTPSYAFMLPTDPTRTPTDVVLQDRDTFLSLNYGGGFKNLRVWGPVGWRWDLRMETMPNFFGHANHWIETTAGLTLSFGDNH